MCRLRRHSYDIPVQSLARALNGPMQIWRTTLASRRSACIAIALALTLGAAHRLGAQDRPKSPFEKLRSDSVAWQRVLVYVVSALSSELVRGAADTSAQAWRLRLPPNEPQRHLLEKQLRTILRARPATSGDAVVHSLDVGPLSISNDTARVEVRVNETRPCSGTTRTTGSGWATTVLVARHPKEKFWGAAFSRVTAVGDRVSC
jgi:hypothetical protein